MSRSQVRPRAAFSSDQEMSVTTDEGERQRFSVFGGITHELTALTTVSGNLRYTNTDFDPVTVDQVPSDDYRLSGRVNHALDNRSSIFAEAGAGWFTSDTDIEIESLSADGRIGGQQQVNQNTSISGSAGASFINIVLWLLATGHPKRCGGT